MLTPSPPASPAVERPPRVVARHRGVCDCGTLRRRLLLPRRGGRAGTRSGG